MPGGYGSDLDRGRMKDVVVNGSLWVLEGSGKGESLVVKRRMSVSADGGADSKDACD